MLSSRRCAPPALAVSWCVGPGSRVAGAARVRSDRLPLLLSVVRRVTRAPAPRRSRSRAPTPSREAQIRYLTGSGHRGPLTTDYKPVKDMIDFAAGAGERDVQGPDRRPPHRRACRATSSSALFGPSPIGLAKPSPRGADDRQRRRGDVRAQPDQPAGARERPTAEQSADRAPSCSWTRTTASPRRQARRWRSSHPRAAAMLERDRARRRGPPVRQLERTTAGPAASRSTSSARRRGARNGPRVLDLLARVRTLRPAGPTRRGASARTTSGSRASPTGSATTGRSCSSRWTR